MDPRTLRECAAALGRTEADVLGLREAADLLPALLARLVLATRQAPDRGDARSAFCAALVESYGSEPFAAADLLEWCDQAPGPRRLLREATQALCGECDRMPTPRQLGMALKVMVKNPPAGFEVIARIVRGTSAWTVMDLRN